MSPDAILAHTWNLSEIFTVSMRKLCGLHSDTYLSLHRMKLGHKTLPPLPPGAHVGFRYSSQDWPGRSHHQVLSPDLGSPTGKDGGDELFFPTRRTAGPTQ